MAEEIAVAITVVMNPASSDERSDTLPINHGDRASPRKWMINRFKAIAVARMWAPAELRIAAFSGAVFSSRRKPAIAIPGTMVRPRVNRAIIMTGIQITMLAAETRSYAPFV